MEEVVKKINVWQAIKGGLVVIKNNPILLISIFIYAILSCLFSFLISIWIKPISPEKFSSFLHLIFPLISLLIAIWLYFFFVCLIIKIVFKAKSGQTSLLEEIKTAQRKIVPLLRAWILYSLITFFGFIFLIIPGIFLSIKFFYYQPAVIIDNEESRSSLKKSWQITKSNWWRTFGLALFFFILTGILKAGSEFLGSPVSFILSFFSFLTWGWMLSAVTLAYLQLTREI
ncbi:MAG: glycerophosphoryl diester phosphodiesterase membrane domain-containing protein [Patescibacteria group bacterium]|nr:glycerophosphoryl diester phosphodiesterase membrane domain-containing protein [Patescibacteria group bacterium]